MCLWWPLVGECSWLVRIHIPRCHSSRSLVIFGLPELLQQWHSPWVSIVRQSLYVYAYPQLVPQTWLSTRKTLPWICSCGLGHSFIVFTFSRSGDIPPQTLDWAKGGPMSRDVVQCSYTTSDGTNGLLAKFFPTFWCGSFCMTRIGDFRRQPSRTLST